MPPISVTRAELYRQVWSQPMSKLAERYGVSDVALAKACAKHEVPRPGRGYWAQLASGQKPRVPPLSKASAGISETIRFHPQSGLPTPTAEGEARPPVPTIEVPARLTDAHAVVRWLETAFESAEQDRHERLTVGPEYLRQASVRKSCVPRALGLLDAVCEALEARGHTVQMRPWGKSNPIMQVVLLVGDQEMPLEIEERLDRKPHVLTAEEREQKTKWNWTNFPKYDYFPAAHLTFRMTRPHYKYTGRKSWWTRPRRSSMTSSVT